MRWLDWNTRCDICVVWAVSSPLLCTNTDMAGGNEFSFFLTNWKIGNFCLTQHLQDCLLCLVAPISPDTVPRSHQRLSPPGGSDQLPAHHGVHEDQRQERQQEEDDGWELIEIDRSVQHRTEGRGLDFLVRKVRIPALEGLNCTFPESFSLTEKNFDYQNMFRAFYFLIDPASWRKTKQLTSYSWPWRKLRKESQRRHWESTGELSAWRRKITTWRGLD